MHQSPHSISTFYWLCVSIFLYHPFRLHKISPFFLLYQGLFIKLDFVDILLLSHLFDFFIFIIFNVYQPLCTIYDLYPNSHPSCMYDSGFRRCRSCLERLAFPRMSLISLTRYEVTIARPTFDSKTIIHTYLHYLHLHIIQNFCCSIW